MSYHRLSQHVVLEITDEVVGKEIMSSPYQFIYRPQSNLTYNELFLSDGSGANSREYGFSHTNENTILNPTPIFYYDTLQPTAGGFHAASRIDNVLTASPSGMIQYRKFRLLFMSGFSYNVPDVIGTMFRCYTNTEVGGVKTTTHHAQIVDYADDTNLVPCVPVTFESDIYNSAIDFLILDFDYLFESTDAAMVELRTLLFQNTVPDSYRFEFSYFGESDVVDYTLSTKTFKRIIQTDVYTQTTDIVKEDNRVYCSLVYTDRKLVFGMKHTAYDFGAYMTRMYGTCQVFHDLTLNHFDDSNVLIDTQSIRLMDNMDTFNEIEYTPIVSDTVDHIEAVCKSVLLSTDGLRLERSATVVIADAGELRTQDLGINVTHEKVYTRIEKKYTTISTDIQTPDVVTVTRPVYYQTQQTEGVITLHPAKQVVQIDGLPITDAGVTVLRLKIGSVVIDNVTGELDKFEIPASVYTTRESMYYVLDYDYNIVTYGSISKS